MITISPRAKENRKENPIAESQCGQAGSGTITPAKLADKQQPIETESTGEDSTSLININSEKDDTDITVSRTRTKTFSW
jgi:hypothetical protein